MNSFYWLRKPASGPSQPSHWSYSALQSLRHCPLQWWLLRASYPHIPEGNYPTPSSPAAFQGQIIHSVLETYSRYVRGHENPQHTQESFPIRKIVNQICDELLQQQAKNPRADINQLKARFSLNRCINLFKKLRRSHLPLPSYPSSQQKKHSPQHQSKTEQKSGFRLTFLLFMGD